MYVARNTCMFVCEVTFFQVSTTARGTVCYITSITYWYQVYTWYNSLYMYKKCEPSLNIGLGVPYLGTCTGTYCIWHRKNTVVQYQVPATSMVQSCKWYHSPYTCSYAAVELQYWYLHTKKQQPFFFLFETASSMNLTCHTIWLSCLSSFPPGRRCWWEEKVCHNIVWYFSTSVSICYIFYIARNHFRKQQWWRCFARTALEAMTRRNHFQKQRWQCFILIFARLFSDAAQPPHHIHCIRKQWWWWCYTATPHIWMFYFLFIFQKQPPHIWLFYFLLIFYITRNCFQKQQQWGTTSGSNNNEEPLPEAMMLLCCPPHIWLLIFSRLFSPMLHHPSSHSFYFSHCQEPF